MSRTPRSPARRPVGVLDALDAAAVVSAALLLAYLASGGFCLGFLGVRRASKPLLVLLVLCSLRVAIPGGSRLSRSLAAAWRRLSVASAALAARSPWAAAAGNATLAFVTVHVAAKAVAFGANLLFPPARPRPFSLPFEGARFAEAFAAWDSGWYFDIARRGYFFDPAGQSSIAFFPLYPLSMRALAWPFGGTDRALWASGIALSCACFLLGLTVLHWLTETLSGERETARRTVLYLAVFPFSYFFTQVYTESLFLLLTVSAVAAATASRWGWAGVFGALASLTRPNGVLILVPLGLLALAGRPRPAALLRRVLPLGLVPAALAVFSAFVYRLSGDPLGWLHAQARWNYTLGNRPWVELMRLVDAIDRSGLYGYFFTDALAPYYFVHGALALALVALTPSVFVRLGVPLGAYLAVSLYVPLTGNALEGIGRYAATLFPVFVLLGTTRSRRLHEALLIGGALLLSLFSSLFVTWHPIY